MATIFNFDYLTGSFERVELFGQNWIIPIALLFLLMFTVSRQPKNFAVIFLPMLLIIRTSGMYIAGPIYVGLIAIGTISLVLAALGADTIGSAVSTNIGGNIKAFQTEFKLRRDTYGSGWVSKDIMDTQKQYDRTIKELAKSKENSKLLPKKRITTEPSNLKDLNLAKNLNYSPQTNSQPKSWELKQLTREAEKEQRNRVSSGIQLLFSEPSKTKEKPIKKVMAYTTTPIMDKMKKVLEKKPFVRYANNPQGWAKLQEDMSNALNNMMGDDVPYENAFKRVGELYKSDFERLKRFRKKGVQST